MFTKHVQAFTKAVNEADRTVEQFVSVFGNVDLGKDRVNFGAFANTLARWKAGPNTLPAYYSHQWDDPFSNIGGVIESEEVSPGDERLPDEPIPGDPEGKSLRDYGGLLVKYQFDEEGLNPKADQVFRLLKARRIVQASFAYDIVADRRTSDGIHELDELELIEVGPTLLGMNPATTLLASKSVADLAKDSGLSEDQVNAVLKAAEKDVSHTFIPSGDEPSKCSLCGKTARAVAHINRLSDDTEHGVKRVTFDGSIEERQRAVFELARQWAQENNVGNGGFYASYVEATFDDRVIILVEGWEDPYGEGVYFEASLSTTDDGAIALGTPEEVVVESTVRPKSRRKALASTTKRKEAGTLPEETEDEEAGTGNGEAGNGNSETEPNTDSEGEDNEDEDEDEVDKVLRETELTELEVLAESTSGGQ